MKERFKDHEAKRDGDPSKLKEEIAQLEQANATLQANEEKYRQLIDSSSEGIWAFDRERNTSFVNQRMADLLGYAPEDLVGRPLTSFLDEGGRAALNKLIVRRGSKAKRAHDLELLRKDGTKVHARISASPLLDRQGHVVGGMALVSDVTAQKRAEDGLRQSEEWFRSLIENAPVAIGIAREGLTTYGNPRYLKMFGYQSNDELQGRPIIEQIAPQDRERTSKFVRAIAEGRRDTAEEELVGLRQDGSMIPFHTAVTRVDLPEGPALLGFFTDITERKAAEEALQRSEQMLQLVLDNVPDRVFWKDLNLNFLGCNRNAARDAGLADPKDIIGKSDHELAWRNSADLYQADDREVIASGRPKLNFEEPQVNADGTTRWLKTSKVPLRDPDGRIFGILGTYEDVTERKQVEEALRNSEERFRTLSEATFEGIVVHADGVVLDVNQMALEETGYAREEVIGRPILDFFAPDSQTVVQEVVSQPVVKAYEAHLLRKNGELRTIRIQARMIEFHGQMARVATIMDVTEQVEARQRIEELVARKEDERQRLRTVLDTLPVGVVIVDGTGQPIDNNAMAFEIWGTVTRDRPANIEEYGSLMGWWSDTGIALKAEDWTVARAIKENRTIIGDLIDVQHLDGSRGTVINSAAPLLDRGKVIGGVVVTEDITRQRELEHEAIAAKERAELYIDLLTHDINNMNAAAQGFLQLVEEKSTLDAKNKQRLAKGQRALEDISGLIEKVKKIQRIEGVDARRSPVDLGLVIEDVVQSFKDHPGKKVTINYRPQLRKLVLASELITDVFSNLIGNAIKHSDGAVTVDINISKILDEGREYYKIAIEDNGPGIPDEVKKRAFSRLQRGKTRASGSGLGLYLVRSLVEDFRGRVWVEDSVPGDHTKGARFVVMLPVVAMPEGGLQ